MASKESELVLQLLEKTEKQTLSWEPTAQNDEFMTTFGGNISITIGPGRDEYGPALIMRDEYNRLMLRVNQLTPEVSSASLQNLHEAARRAALRVDESLDIILDALKKLSESCCV